MRIHVCYVGAIIGLLDYGQSKQLPPKGRLALANLIVAVDDSDSKIKRLYSQRKRRTGKLEMDFDVLYAGRKIGLLDYGQSKQLPPIDRLALANLIISLEEKGILRISPTMDRLGIKTSSTDAAVRAKMGYGMFDTRLK